MRNKESERIEQSSFLKQSLDETYRLSKVNEINNQVSIMKVIDVNNQEYSKENGNTKEK